MPFLICLTQPYHLSNLAHKNVHDIHLCCGNPDVSFVLYIKGAQFHLFVAEFVCMDGMYLMSEVGMCIS